MGARQSKRVDISGSPKKGDLENGAATGTEEKLEKIEEGESASTKVNANGSATTTSTLTAEQQEAAASAVTVVSSTEPEKVPEPSKVEGEESGKSEEVSSPTTAPSEDKEQEPSSPASPIESTTVEEGGSDKKKKPKKKWSFRSWSFSKKDKVKPVPKDEKQETVPEDNEGAAQQVTPEVTNVSCVHNEEPPPLPTSPPPTPAEEAPVEKEETPTISEGDVDASGGGEGLAEPIEDAELVEPTSVVAAVEPPLTNGVAELNGSAEMNGKLAEDEDLISPVCERITSVETVTAKIGSLKLQITSDNTESPTQNGMDETSPIEMNGITDKTDPSLDNAVVEN